MTAFSLDVADWKPVVAVVAAHGMTDLNTLDCLPYYATCALVPMPSVCVTGIFCLSSFMHFAEDGGPWITFLAHAGVALIGAHKGADAAFKTMLAYLLLWHTPNHYYRHHKEGRRRGLRIAGLATALGLLLCHRLPNRLPLTNWMQRIVIAHISHEMALR
jgi:hypothetical protein